MNSSESILETLKYIDGLSKRSTEKETRGHEPLATDISVKNSIQENTKTSYVQEKKLKVQKKDSVVVAEPHLKQFASMLSEELANIKRIQQEELERIEAEEIERIRLEEAEKIRLEAAREKIRLEEEKARQAYEEKIRLEEELKRAKIQEEQQKSLTENVAKEPVQQIKEYVDNTYRKPEVNQSILPFSENKKQQRNLKEQTDFVTFEDLKKHYSDFLTKINTQLASLGGGGEVLMRGLDDVDMSTIQDGDFISFDAATRKFVGGSIAPGPEGVVEGGSF